MSYMMDSNILLRFTKPSDPDHGLVRTAVRTLKAHGEILSFAPQNLVEFWNVCTRPATARGGFGLTVAQTDRKARLVERLFRLLPDSPAIHVEWRRLVVVHTVTGVSVHDARIVAAMLVHGQTHLLTFDDGDFARYPGIIAVHPRDI
jgi:predicted nucleic acid-binding protein